MATQTQTSPPKPPPPLPPQKVKPKTRPVPTLPPPAFSFKDATMDLILEDLSTRFILNLPDNELSSVERVCFQVEQAHWYYEDFIRQENPGLPSMALRSFSAKLFAACPLLQGWSHRHEEAFADFVKYKTSVPVCGAILLNNSWDKCILVKGWKSSAPWGFPRGKINENEPLHNCAIREVLEETGFDCESRLQREVFITLHAKDQQLVTLFVVPDVPEDYQFLTRTRKEISKIDWFQLASLPGWGDDEPNHRGATTVNRNLKTWNVSAFLSQLKARLPEFRQAFDYSLSKKNQNRHQSTSSRVARATSVQTHGVHAESQVESDDLGDPDDGPIPSHIHHNESSSQSSADPVTPSSAAADAWVSHSTAVSQPHTLGLASSKHASPLKSTRRGKTKAKMQNHLANGLLDPHVSVDEDGDLQDDSGVDGQEFATIHLNNLMQGLLNSSNRLSPPPANLRGDAGDAANTVQPASAQLENSSSGVSPTPTDGASHSRSIFDFVSPFDALSLPSPTHQRDTRAVSPSDQTLSATPLSSEPPTTRTEPVLKVASHSLLTSSNAGPVNRLAHSDITVPPVRVPDSEDSDPVHGNNLPETSATIRTHTLETSQRAMIRPPAPSAATPVSLAPKQESGGSIAHLALLNMVASEADAAVRSSISATPQLTTSQPPLTGSHNLSFTSPPISYSHASMDPRFTHTLQQNSAPPILSIAHNHTPSPYTIASQPSHTLNVGSQRQHLGPSNGTPTFVPGYPPPPTHAHPIHAQVGQRSHTIPPAYPPGSLPHTAVLPALPSSMGPRPVLHDGPTGRFHSLGYLAGQNTISNGLVGHLPLSAHLPMDRRMSYPREEQCPPHRMNLQPHHSGMGLANGGVHHQASPVPANTNLNPFMVQQKSPADRNLLLEMFRSKSPMQPTPNGPGMASSSLMNPNGHIPYLSPAQQQLVGKLPFRGQSPFAMGARPGSAAPSSPMFGSGLIPSTVQFRAISAATAPERRGSVPPRA